MTSRSELLEMEAFYMALADKTRLRILNLIRDREVCVLDFTEVLGDSQPKISRHLAYLRSAGVVEARRDGKWMYYSIRWPEESGARAALRSTLEWLDSHEQSMADNGRYRQAERHVISPSSSKMSQQPDVNEARHEVTTHDRQTERPSHNELEEFLL